MDIKNLIETAHNNAKNKGFWGDWVRSDTNNAISCRLMLIVSELAEAQSALRLDDYENFKEELADVAIRLADLCGGLDIDLEYEIEIKMLKNIKRPYKHGRMF